MSGILDRICADKRRHIEAAKAARWLLVKGWVGEKASA